MEKFFKQLRWLPRNILNYIRSLPAMRPRAKIWGWRYYWDYEFRRKAKQKELSRKVRQVRGSGFQSRIRRVKSNLAKMFGAKCQSCKTYFDLSLLTVDHIVKVKDCGTNNYKNLQLLCRPCHDLKDFNFKGTTERRWEF